MGGGRPPYRDWISDYTPPAGLNRTGPTPEEAGAACGSGQSHFRGNAPPASHRPWRCPMLGASDQGKGIDMEFAAELGISGREALLVIISTAGVYGADRIPALEDSRTGERQ